MEHFLRALFEIDGVTGALLVGKDGLIIASAMEPARAELHAAQAAAAFDVLATYARQLSPGTSRLVLIETGTGCLALGEAADLLIVAEATSNVNLGHLRLEVRRIARAILAQLRA